MNDKEEKFLNEYLNLCKKHDLCITGCCMIGISTLNDCYAVSFNENDDAIDLYGSDAHKHRIKKDME